MIDAYSSRCRTPATRTGCAAGEVPIVRAAAIAKHPRCRGVRMAKLRPRARNPRRAGAGRLRPARSLAGRQQMAKVFVPSLMRNCPTTSPCRLPGKTLGSSSTTRRRLPGDGDLIVENAGATRPTARRRRRALGDGLMRRCRGRRGHILPPAAAVDRALAQTPTTTPRAVLAARCGCPIAAEARLPAVVVNARSAPPARPAGHSARIRRDKAAPEPAPRRRRRVAVAGSSGKQRCKIDGRTGTALNATPRRANSRAGLADEELLYETIDNGRIALIT